MTTRLEQSARVDGLLNFLWAASGPQDNITQFVQIAGQAVIIAKFRREEWRNVLALNGGIFLSMNGSSLPHPTTVVREE